MTRGGFPDLVNTLKPAVCAGPRLQLCRPITLEMRNVWQSEVWVVPHRSLPRVAALRTKAGRKQASQGWRDSSVPVTPY